MRSLVCGCLLGLLLVTPAAAGPADVVSVSVAVSGPGQYRFSVTVRHADEGWDHYADRWEVLHPDGTLLGSAPFTTPMSKNNRSRATFPAFRSLTISPPSWSAPTIPCTAFPLSRKP